MIISINKEKKYKRTGYAAIIALGFMMVIIVGTLLLFLFGSRGGFASPRIMDCLFTATSSTCVTGLIPFDTYTNWNLFGQVIILAMIQVGGLGFMTIAMVFLLALRKRIGLRNKTLLMESISVNYLGDIVKISKHVIKGTALFEGLGFIILTIRFMFEMSPMQAVWNGLFHSISAFCNAGFDLMGRFKPSSSLTRFEGDPTINIVIMSLIIIGGLGFFVWEDIYKYKFKFKKYHLHSKIVLTATTVLLIGGTVLFFLLEKDNAFSGRSFFTKCQMAAFASVTPRTAGFNTADIPSMTMGSKLLSMVLMMIGGSPGSTAGGIKTTTIVILMLATLSTITGRSYDQIFKRRISTLIAKKAAGVFFLDVSLVITGVFIIVSTSSVSLESAFFEACSAMGTVGMTMGLSGSCTTLTQIILILLMYLGRVGGVTFAMMFTEKSQIRKIQYPREKINVG